MVHAVLFSHSGGISIKPSANMDLMRADMGGAATICSAIVSAAKLNLPINIVGEGAKGGVLESSGIQSDDRPDSRFGFLQPEKIKKWFSSNRSCLAKCCLV